MGHSILLAAAMVAGGCPGQQAVLDAAAQAIERDYVIEAEARQIADSVRGWAADKRYADACGDWPAFVERFNRDLDAYDGHFHAERPDGGQAGSGDDWLMAWRATGVASNMGVREVRVFEGNVGYLRLSSFYPWDLAAPKIRNALELLKDTEGLVLDLRQNGGGDDRTAGQLVRAFLGDDVSAVQRIESRNGTRPDPLPARDVPAYDGRVVVLVDRRSASASEFVAYTLQAAGRAAVVGSRSAGAATMFDEPVALPDAVQLFIPDARPVNLTTGGNWNREGVKPDIAGGDDPVHVARRVISGDLKVPSPAN